MNDRKEKSGQRMRLVYDAVVEGIARREWKPGDKLPSVRIQSERLKVHRLTVLKAYRKLKDEGIIEVKYKSGYFVCRVPAAVPTPGAGIPDDRLHWDYGVHKSTVNRNRAMEFQSQSVEYQMSKALIDPKLLPNRYLSNHVRQVFDIYPKVLSTYSDVMGDLELREAMAGYFLQKHGIVAGADEMMVTTGAQQAIDLVSRSLVKPGDTVLIETPTYGPAIELFRQQNAKLIPIPISQEGYDLDRVEQIMNRHRPRLFYVNPTFHNPTGFTVPSPQRKRLVELAESYQCILVEDDINHDIYFECVPPPPLFFYDTEGYVVYIRSFSKYVAPGLRVAFLTARPPVMNCLVPMKALTDHGSPLLGQKIFQHYFFSDRLQAHIAKLRTALQLRKEKMEAQLAGTGWQWASPKGGLNLWIRLPEEITAESLLERCLNRSVAFLPGAICDPLGLLNNRIRLSYSFINEPQLEEGIKRLIAAADTLKGIDNTRGT
ncbi:DNA-binding transcriptional MocR family regulator [Fontibacillus phaseoli]|uniref:DNA-binding transcriptional MocR family regulator n=1 Tax=Fontibacillus phaseoli TaxID=1416533 RepID=A0A369BQK2_9BACL|nr:PLP-dependent aminotransferase family protein [Fontibacillus phaseoli]RCX22876.1 DNA-binding transcriptional MocR family regulator [Fontibacillus phaseoli]